MNLKKTLSLISLSLALCQSAFLCSAQGFVIVEGKSPHELNPQITSYSSDAQILTGLYEGLFSYNPLTLEADYAIASDVRISRDKKRWTINLRQNAKFSNGEAITAVNVRNSWLRLLSDQRAPYASLLDIIWNASEYRHNRCVAENVGIYVTGEYSLSIRLNSPANYLPKVLCHSAFSVMADEENVYSGPYVLAEKTESSYLLKKNPYYWDAENVKLEEITFLQSDDEKENAYLFNTGKADWVTNNVFADSVINKNALMFRGLFGTAYYFFKHSRKNREKNGSFNPWDFPEFRNAILEALPWDALRANAAIPATTFVYPLSGYNAPEGFDYTDEKEAILMMEAAREKYDRPSGEVYKLTFEVSEFTLSDDKKDAMKNALLPLGVELVFREIPSHLYLQNVAYSSSDLFAYTWIGDFADPLAFLELFRGASSLNDSGWMNEDYDRLISAAALSSDYERYKLLSQAEKILLDSGMVIPVYHPVSFNLINLDEVGGWSSNAFDIHPLKFLYRKEVMTKIPNVVMR